MSNVEQKKEQSKSVALPIPAPGTMTPTPLQKVLSGEMTERERQTAAISTMAGKGFAANVKSATVLEEPELEKNKENLVGIPFVILAIQENEGDYGPFVSVTCQLETDELVVFNDGSSGIMAQLEGQHDKCPIFVASGLRVSDYINKHTNTKSRTYYLSGQGARKAIAALKNGRELHSNI